MSAPVDIQGNEIKVGDKVAFAWYHRDSCLATGEVKKFTNKSIVVEPDGYGYRKVVPQHASAQQLIIIK